MRIGHRERRVSPPRRAPSAAIWALRRSAANRQCRRPGDREVLHLAAEEKIALPLLLTVCRHHILKVPLIRCRSAGETCPFGRG